MNREAAEKHREPSFYMCCNLSVYFIKHHWIRKPWFFHWLHHWFFCLRIVLLHVVLGKGHSHPIPWSNFIKAFTFLFEVSLLPYICSDKVIFIILTVEVISADLQGSKECYSLCCSMPSVLVLSSSLLVSSSETSFQDLYLNNICSWLQVYLPYL